MRTVMWLPLVLPLSTACQGSSDLPDPPGERVGSDLERDLDPDVDTATLQSLTASNRAFALDLYGQLASADGNLMFSPHSVSIAMALTYAGAAGETATELADVLHFDLAEDELHPAFNLLDLDLASRADEVPARGDGSGFELSVVNQAFGQAGMPFEQPYLDVLAEQYGAAMRLLDYAADPEAAREAINDWVLDATNDRIEDLMPPGSITGATRMVLANAIYFKASWLVPFSTSETRPEAFDTLDAGEVTVDTMHGTVEDGAFYTGEGFVVAELPYLGESVTMGLLVPDAGRFSEIEASLDHEALGAAIDGLVPATVDLAMPKFEFDSDFDLIPPFQALGLEAPFSGADFSRMTTAADLTISGIFHKSFIAVNEEGTEAAAATGVAFDESAAGKFAELTVDRPFLFWIRDRPSGAVLFLGRVVDPSAG